MAKLTKPGKGPKLNGALQNPEDVLKMMEHMAKEMEEGPSKPTTIDEKMLTKFICEAMVQRYANAPFGDDKKDVLASEFSLGALTALTMMKLDLAANIQELHKLGQVFGTLRVYADMLDTASKTVDIGFKEYLHDDTKRIKDLTSTIG